METLDFMFWFRQLVGFSIGMSAGMMHLTGTYVIIGFIGIIFVLSNFYASKVLNISEKDFQNNELLMEGLPNAFGIFIVSAILLLSYLSTNSSSAIVFIISLFSACFIFL